LGKLVRVKLDDLLFQLFDTSHDISSIRRPNFRPPNGPQLIGSELTRRRN
jgi:hypothetical protein